MSLTKRIFSIVLFLVAIAVLVTLITSCSPLEQAQPGPTATVKPTPTILSIQATTTPQPPTCRVTGETVYLRPDPSKAGAPLAVLQAGQILQIIKRGDWLHVQTRSTTGYIYSAFCQE